MSNVIPFKSRPKPRTPPRKRRYYKAEETRIKLAIIADYAVRIEQSAGRIRELVKEVWALQGYKHPKYWPGEPDPLEPDNDPA